jgi:integrase
MHFRADKNLWQFEAELPRGSDGKRRKRVVYGRTELEVRTKVADLVARGGGSLRPVDPTRISDFAEKWLTRCDAQLAPKTAESYRWAWGHASPIVGGVRFEKFDRETALTLFSELGRRDASPNTIRHVARVMQTLVQDAIAEGVLKGENPFKIVASRKPKHKPEKGRALSVAEARRFLEAARDDRLEAAWILGLTAGLRIAEIFGLQWADFDASARAIHVRRQAVVVGGKILIQEFTKTEDSLRLLPLGPLAVAALKRRAKVASTEPTSLWIFPGLNPLQPVNPTNARRRNFAETVKRALIAGKFTPHDLRHTMNSLADSVGVTEKVRSERMGHADSAITRAVYTHTIDGQARDAAAKIDSLLV